jgi:hypothetical protein
VEGNDDVHVFYALFKKHSIPDSFEVIDAEGVDKLLEGLPIRLKSDVNTLGMVLDANSDLNARWQTLTDILRDEDYVTPATPGPVGTILSQPLKPKIGIWLMPDNRLPGMLEDFVRFLIPVGDPLVPQAERILGDLEAKRLNRYPAHKRAKAFIHTWLAWQDEPGTPMGLSITKNYLSENPVLCQQFLTWIKNLFG